MRVAELGNLEFSFRHILEVDNNFDCISFFLRSAFTSVSRLNLDRLGSFQSFNIDIPLTGARSYINRNHDFGLRSATASQLLFARHFSKLRGRKIMRCGGEELDASVVHLFQPDVIIHDSEAIIADSFIKDKFELGSQTFHAGFRDEQSEKIFRNSYEKFHIQSNHWREKRSLILDCRDVISPRGFYHAENDGLNFWKWTGSSKSLVFYIPNIQAKSVKITLFLYAVYCDLDSGFRTFVNGQAADATYLKDWSKIEIEAQPHTNDPALIVELLHGHLPHTPDGSRQLGVAVSKIEIART